MTSEQIEKAALLLCEKRKLDPHIEQGKHFIEAKKEVKAFVDIAQCCEQVFCGEVTI